MLHAIRTELRIPRTDRRAPAKTYLLGLPRLPVHLLSYHHGKHTTHTHTQTYTHCQFARPDVPSFFFKIFFYLDHFLDHF